jgi:transcription elongation factor SPT6
VIKGPQTVKKIRKALELIRNQHFEVPFIAFYRKEYVLPELSVYDLWRVYKFDEKWTQLQTRKNNMMRLFKKIQKYRSEKPNENVRVLKDEDIDRLRMVESIEELSDVYNYFILYYGNDVLAMREEYRRNTAARQRLNEDGELMDADDMKEDLHDPDEDLYSRGASAGLDGLLRKYGLSRIEQFADNYQRHDIHQSQTTKDPCDVALEYAFSKFPNVAEFLKAANYMLAVQIAKEPSVRKFVRESFFERARFDVIPTKEGLKKINEMHDLYSLKFLKDKPARDLVDDQFLRLWVAEQDKLLTIVFPTKIEGAITASYVDEIIKALLTRDESSKLVQELNVQRKEIIDLALSKFVLPSMVKELKAKLLNEAQEFVKRACCQQLYNCLNVSFIVTQIFFPFH